MLNKTTLLFSIAFLAVGGFIWLRSAPTQAQQGKFPYQLSDKEWKEKLPAQAYQVLRHHSTERPNTSPLNKEKRDGQFTCAGCDQKLFASDHKYESGTGWPSFFKPRDAKAVGTRSDNKFLMKRTEVHCSNCGGHLGHVFGDGPKPTGKRYCINGAALKFVPEIR